jgi:hypothetical protein
MHCLVKAHPSFADVPLSHVALPGAENAGTFNLDPQAFDNQAGSDCSTINAGASVGAAKLLHFSATQDQPITRQLSDGVRWIDLDVGYNGGGNPITGWRVVQNLYSSWPLSEYLDQVANWANTHPTEAVVVDLSTICYDHNPTPAVEEGLWANFTAKSVEGAGPKTMADVAARPSSFGGSLATATLADLTKPGHNVAVLIPATAKASSVLPDKYHVDPIRTSAPGQATGASTEVVRSDPTVAPTRPTQFPLANLALGSFPTKADPALGSLHGTGLYVSKLAYELRGASTAVQTSVMGTFVGLVASAGPYLAWNSGLWTGAYQQILAHWGHSTNVVLADGVDQGGFVPQVIERNGR